MAPMAPKDRGASSRCASARLGGRQDVAAIVRVGVRARVRCAGTEGHARARMCAFGGGEGWRGRGADAALAPAADAAQAHFTERSPLNTFPLG